MADIRNLKPALYAELTLFDDFNHNQINKSYIIQTSFLVYHLLPFCSKRLF